MPPAHPGWADDLSSDVSPRGGAASRPQLQEDEAQASGRTYCDPVDCPNREECQGSDCYHLLHGG